MKLRCQILLFSKIILRRMSFQAFVYTGSTNRLFSKYQSFPLSSLPAFPRLHAPAFRGCLLCIILLSISNVLWPHSHIDHKCAKRSSGCSLDAMQTPRQKGIRVDGSGKLDDPLTRISYKRPTEQHPEYSQGVSFSSATQERQIACSNPMFGSVRADSDTIMYNAFSLLPGRRSPVAPRNPNTWTSSVHNPPAEVCRS